jgi:hypothetical protein
MPVPVPTESRIQSTGVLFWAEGDRTHPRLLAEVKGVWSCTSAAPCMLSWRGQLTQLYLFFYLFTYIPGNVST